MERIPHKVGVVAELEEVETTHCLETTAPVSLDEVIVKFESRVSRDSFMESIRILIDEEKIRINEDRIHFVGR